MLTQRNFVLKKRIKIRELLTLTNVIRSKKTWHLEGLLEEKIFYKRAKIQILYIRIVLPFKGIKVYLNFYVELFIKGNVKLSQYVKVFCLGFISGMNTSGEEIGGFESVARGEL